MCGIAGVADLTGRAIDRDLVPAMCEAIRHRGPDEGGVEALPRSPAGRRSAAVLGSRRLSIIDVAGGHQPLANEDGTVWVVMNGEIYNFQELRRDLEARGHRFATHSDTEVLVHLYEDRGPAFVAALEGMFALALWDERADRLILARDRFGKKPLVYAESRGRIVFASELQGLMLDSTIDRTVDLEALDYYLTHLAIPAPLTIYRGIRKVPPAHLLRWDRSGAHVERYWDLRYGPKRDITEDEACERIRHLMREAVRKRLISEVPLGAFLSGGVDSSGVVAHMAQLMDQPVKTFSIGFEEEDYNELPHARRVAAAFGCDHHEFIVKARAAEVLPILARHYGEPFADSSAIPSYYLSRMTRQHVTVALNGDGGDETFAGYGWQRAAGMAERWQRVPRAVRLTMAGAARALTPRSASRRTFLARVDRFLQGVDRTRPDRYRAWAGFYDEPLKNRLVLPEARVRSVPGILDRLFDTYAELDAVDAALAVDTLFYLPTDLLVKMDIATMANSLEARSPLLDHHLVEFVARLPSRMKTRGGKSKYLLKKTLAGLVPRENLTRPKRGFSVPLAEWIRGELRELVSDHLLGRRFGEHGIFDQRVIASMLDAHQHRTVDYSHHLYILLMYELWSQASVAAAAAVPQPVGPTQIDSLP